MDSNKVTWGIIGAGRIARTFAEDIAHASNATLQAVASRSAPSARDFAARHGIAQACESYAELMASADVDAIYIATPHTCHASQTMDAIRSGKSVLCEKPFTVTPDECEEIIACAGGAGVFVMEALWSYFLPAIRKARTWVDDGRIGRIVQIHSSFGYPLAYAPDKREYDARLGGGCLLEMGIYPIAINWLFTQHAPESISVASQFAPNGVEDDVVMMFDYQDSVSTLATSYRARLPNASYIIGEDAYIAIPDSFRASECFLYEMDELKEHFTDGRRGKGFEYQIEAASDDILNGRTQSSIMPLATSLALQQQMAMVKAAFRR